MHIEIFLGRLHVRTKTSLNKFKKSEIISGFFCEHNAMKLETSHKRNTEKYTETYKLNNMLINNEWVNNEIKEEIKRHMHRVAEWIRKQDPYICCLQ